MLAALIGCIAGAVGAAPLLSTEYLRKARLRKGKETSIAFLLGLVLISLVLMSAFLIVCAKVSRPSLLEFAIGMMVTFLVLILVVSLVRIKRFGK
ncbi:MAG: hypothetical protein IKE61_00535 [Coriobacteriales bacterium]|nr:hypothetical protein [Coriobacteriales bacterium]